MESSEDIFELNFKDGKIRVQMHLVSNQTFTEFFFQKKNPLVINRALTENASHWWTSIPEDWPRKAEEIGQLIEKYFSSFN